MSTEDDPELRDLITRCLENSGVLGKIRAQLRANTFLAIDQQDDPKVKFTISNSAVQSLAKSKSGVLALSLVREFLSFFSMQYTLSVFDPESCDNVAYQHLSRSALASQLGLNITNQEEPIICSLLSQLGERENRAGESSATKLPLVMQNLKWKSIPDKATTNGDDYDEDFQSSSGVSTPKKNGDHKENGINNLQSNSVEEDLDVSTSDLLASQSSNTAEQDTADKSASNSCLDEADHVEKLHKSL